VRSKAYQSFADLGLAVECMSSNTTTHIHTHTQTKRENPGRLPLNELLHYFNGLRRIGESYHM